MKRGVKFCVIGLALIWFVFAGMFLAKGSDSQERPQQSDRRIPIPVPNVLVVGRVLTDVGETPVAGALVRLEPVDRDIPQRLGQEGTDPGGSDGNQTQKRPESSNEEAEPKSQADFEPLPEKNSGPDGSDRIIAPYPRPSLQAFTHGDGGFRVAAFPGKFIVRIEANGFETEYYDDVEDREDARRIELTPTTVPIKLLIKLKSVSTIAGTATVEGTGQPVPLGQVVANPEFRGIRRSGTIRPDGSYLIEGLSEGRYWIHGTARGFLPGTFVAEGSESERSIVTVRANSHVTGIDFILSRGLSFFGVVRVSEAGTGLAGAIVTASRVNAREGLSQTAETESDGSYTMSGLVQGEYIVNARKAGYGFQLYPNTKDRRDAESVIVAEDLHPEGVDFSLSIVGTILGKVTAKDGGEPVQGAMVIAYSASGIPSRGVKTDVNGMYVISDLPTSDYLVAVNAEDFAQAFYPDATNREDAQLVRVFSDAHTTGIDFSMGPMGKIAGTVNGPQGPIGGATVTLMHRFQIRPLPLETHPVSSFPYPHAGVVSISRTDADGSFRFENLKAGTYVIRVEEKRFIGAYYDDVRSLDAATPIEVAASQSVVGIGFRLAPLGVIEGGVTSADGGIFEGLQVVAFRTPPSDPGDVIFQPPGPKPLSERSTAGGEDRKDGGVSSNVQGRGELLPDQRGGSLDPSVSDDGRSVSTADGARPFNPPGGEGEISDLPEASPIPHRRGLVGFRGEVDLVDGSYRIVGLAGGDYVVRAFADGYVPKFNGDAESSDQVSPISVTEGEKTVGIDFVLMKGGAIEGFVLGDGDGRPVRGGTVTAQLLGGGGGASRVEANGGFRVDGLRDGKYLLKAEAPHYIGEFYDDTRQPDKAQVIEIDGGNTVTFLILGLAHRSPADLNGDGDVDLEDMFTFAQGFGLREDSQHFNEALDLNLNGKVDLEDFFAFVDAFNKGEEKAGKPALEHTPGRVSFQRVEAPPGLIAVRMAVEASELAGYAVKVDYTNELKFKRAAGSGPIVSSTPGEILVTGRADGPISITLYFEGLEEGWENRITPRMVALLGTDGVLRILENGFTVDPVGMQKTDLFQNVPNPFNPATQIGFFVSREGSVRLAIYNLLGQRVRTVVDGHRASGHHVVTWDGRDERGRSAASGIYFYRLTAQGSVQTRKMMLLR